MLYLPPTGAAQFGPSARLKRSPTGPYLIPVPMRFCSHRRTNFWSLSAVNFVQFYAPGQNLATRDSNFLDKCAI